MKKQKYKKIYNISSIKNKDIKETVEKRYNILIIIIIVIMLILGINLFVVQVLRHDYYINKVAQLSQNFVTSTSTPRGRIYDRNGEVIVDNEAVKVIFYKKPANITTKDEIATAYKAAELISLDYDKLSKDNLKKFWVLNNQELAKQKITAEEWIMLDERKLTSSDIENLKIERVTDSELATFGEEDKLAAYIYYLMNVGYSYDEKVIKKLPRTLTTAPPSVSASIVQPIGHSIHVIVCNISVLLYRKGEGAVDGREVILR